MLKEKKPNQTNKKNQKKPHQPTKTTPQPKLEDYTYQNRSLGKLFIIPYFRMEINSTGKARKVGNINTEMYCS